MSNWRHRAWEWSDHTLCKGVRCCCFSGATTVISVSTKREPWALCVPQLPLRHSTPVPHYPLGRVVRRLDAFQRHARPQRRTQLEARPTDARGLRGATRAAGFEPLFDLSTQRTPNAPQARPLQWPIVDAMPPGKQLTPMALQGFPDFLEASTASDHRFNVPQQMRPTKLTPPPWIPVVCTPAISDHDISDCRPEEGTGHLATTRQAPQQHHTSGPKLCSQFPHNTQIHQHIGRFLPLICRHVNSILP
jgi:hypothetical protein